MVTGNDRGEVAISPLSDSFFADSELLSITYINPNLGPPSVSETFHQSGDR